MTKNCGTCGKCRNTHDGPHCYKGRTPKPVSPLMVMDCWTDPAEEEPAPAATKVCSRCGRELPITEFGRHSRTKWCAKSSPRRTSPVSRSISATAPSGQKASRSREPAIPDHSITKTKYEELL